MIMESKYNFDLDMVNTNSLSLIINQIKRGSTVLEFGPANGRMTRYLKEALDCSVYLVEIDEKAGKEASVYAEDLLIDDIETYSWLNKYEKLRFDYITFADVLEHLRDPEQVLIHAKGLLKQDGSILLSVPNLAHNAVLINLINNEFEYNKVGLLDNTHIHFFTRNSLENMMNRVGLVVSKRYATYTPVEGTEIPVQYDSVQGIDPSFWKNRPYGDIYQFVYEVKKGTEFITETENCLSAGRNVYHFQVYFDRGKGCREDESQTFAIRNIYEDQSFVFDVGEDVRSLRIDFLNAPCMVNVLSCVDIVDGKENPLRIMETNADFRHKDTFVFSIEDPLVVYGPGVGRRFHRVFLNYRFLSSDLAYVKAVGEIWDQCQRRVECLEEEKKGQLETQQEIQADLQRQIQDLRGQLEYWQKENASLHATMQELLGSTSWRFTKPLRRIGDILHRKH